MASLAQLRESLASLNSYRLPERYQNDPDRLNSSNVLSSDRLVLDEKSFQRYRTARETYLKSRVTELFLSHLATYDGVNNTIALPPLPSPEEEEEIHNVEEKVKREMEDTVLKLKASFRNVYDNYAVLSQRREELTRILQDMEKDRSAKGVNDVMVANSAHGGDEDIDENDVLLMEEKLQTLMKQRGDLEMKLRDIKMEKQELAYQVQQRKERVKEFAKARGSDLSQEKLSNGLPLDSPLTVEQLETETNQLRQRCRFYREMAEYYNSERCALEEIGGMKILSAVPFENGDSIGDSQSSSSTSQSVARRRRSSSASSLTTTRSNSSDTKSKEGIYLKVLLLKQHIVKVTLVHQDVPNSDGNDELLRVTQALFETSTVLPIPSGNLDQDNPSQNNLSITIPPLDDLVRLATQMDPGYDLRFLLRETIARIRSLTARVEELAFLRAKYLTKFANISNSYGFGGEDQEVVCSLNVGITVVLRLTADCPILDGSCYIYQLVGVGGWDEGVLQRMKTRVNGMKSRKGPVEVMDSLVEEIGRLEKHEGLVIPKTPPSLRKN